MTIKAIEECHIEFTKWAKPICMKCDSSEKIVLEIQNDEYRCLNCFPISDMTVDAIHTKVTNR